MCDACRSLDLILTGKVGDALLVQVSSVYERQPPFIMSPLRHSQASILVLPLLVLATGEAPAGFPQLKSVAYGSLRVSRTVSLKSCSRCAGVLMKVVSIGPHGKITFRTRNESSLTNLGRIEY